MAEEVSTGGALYRVGATLCVCGCGLASHLKPCKSDLLSGTSCKFALISTESS